LTSKQQLQRELNLTRRCGRRRNDPGRGTVVVARRRCRKGSLGFGAKTGQRNANVIYSLMDWAKRDGTGVCFATDTGFTLPNSAKRGPDAAWVRLERWNKIPEEQQERLAPLCPDFVIDLRSPSDHLSDLERKMEEYIANGAQLGWLLDPFDKCAVIYRAGQTPARIENPGSNRRRRRSARSC